jgi:Uma2 family endonuclease
MNRSPSKRKRTAAVVAPQQWRFSADQYQRMGEIGLFRREDHVELLEGVIYQMTPIGSWHNGSISAMNMLFTSPLAGRAVVQVQGSLRLSPDSEPEPDLLVLRFRPDFYRSALAGPEDVLLLVEVADTSLGYDRGIKLPLYARAGIPEVWIVNRNDACVEVYREPRGASYESVSLGDPSSSVSPLAFPELNVTVKDLLG